MEIDNVIETTEYVIKNAGGWAQVLTMILVAKRVDTTTRDSIIQEDKTKRFLRSKELIRIIIRDATLHVYKIKTHKTESIRLTEHDIKNVMGLIDQGYQEMHYHQSDEVNQEMIKLKTSLNSLRDLSKKITRHHADAHRMKENYSLHESAEMADKAQELIDIHTEDLQKIEIEMLK